MYVVVGDVDGGAVGSAVIAGADWVGCAGSAVDGSAVVCAVAMNGASEAAATNAHRDFTMGTLLLPAVLGPSER
jgi:hypothetical protein